jgi:hypothetical protein
MLFDCGENLMNVFCRRNWVQESEFQIEISVNLCTRYKDFSAVEQFHLDILIQGIQIIDFRIYIPENKNT